MTETQHRRIKAAETIELAATYFGSGFQLTDDER